MTLERALDYAASGWGVHPIHPTTKKAVSPWLSDNTLDESKITEMWTRWPNSRPATIPGRQGHLVFDVDVKGGARGMEKARELGLLELETLTARTLSGGLHIYVQRHTAAKVGNLGTFKDDGIDIRCDSGYVALYDEWLGEGSDAAPMPAHIAALLTPAPRMAAAHASLHVSTDAELELRIRAYMGRLPTGLSEGQGRNNSMYGFCAWLTHDLALSTSDAEPWAREHNASYGDPLCERELEATLGSAAKHGARRIGAGLEGRTFTPFWQRHLERCAKVAAVRRS